MFELSNEIKALGLLLIVIAAWLKFGAKPGMATLVAALVASAQL